MKSENKIRRPSGRVVARKYIQEVLANAEYYETLASLVAPAITLGERYVQEANKIADDPVRFHSDKKIVDSLREEAGDLFMRAERARKILGWKAPKDPEL